MAIIPLANQSYARTGLPKARLINLYREITPEGPTPYTLRQRPGLVQDSTVGFGPIRCIVTHQGARFVVSGTRVFRAGVQIGLIAGSGIVRFAQSDTELVFVVGGVAYLAGTSSLTAITIPDGDEVSDVAFAAGRFIYSISDTGKFRYSEIGDATDIGDLNFATAESNPDAITAVITLGDDVLFFGESSTEWWAPTQDTAAPFQRYNGRRYDIGCAAQFSAIRIDNGCIWVGTSQRQDRTDLRVYHTGAVAEVISTPAIDALLARCADISLATAFEAPVEGRSFYVLSIPGVATMVRDMREGLWSEWSSYEADIFRVRCADGGVYGDAVSNQLWTLDLNANTDGDDPIVRICSANYPVLRRDRCVSVELFGARGEATTATEPVVEIRYTDHEDADWSDWYEAPIGPTGVFPRARWTGLGMMEAPGRTFEFRCSEDVLFAPYGLTVNDRL